MPAAVPDDPDPAPAPASNDPAPAPATNVLVVQHTASEHAARLGGWLEQAGATLTVARPYDGSDLPAGLDGYQGLLVLGGPQAAYPDPATGAWSAPWLPAVLGLLREAVGTGTPALGICLGAQLLAQAMGGRVAPGDRGPEIGPGLVAKRDGAIEDALFGDLPLTPDVLQWHDDAVVDLPPGASLLAAGARYDHQAFRVGARAWGVQFHIEADEPMLRGWAAEERDRLAALSIDADRAVELAVARLADVEETWQPVAARFVELAAAGSQVLGR